ncbi:acetate/propionate family kinase [candidate division KSB1 bacterium]
MKILVINCGSSTIKYQLIEPETEEALAKGKVERIGMDGAVLTHKAFDRDEVKISAEILDHNVGIEYIVSILLSKNHGVIKDKKEIDAIGHRVVHGGEIFSDSVLINEAVLKQIRACIEFAPLHNPHNLRGINACIRFLSDVPQVAVFDTAFHQQMPEVSYIYGIPYLFYKKYGIRKYGFHGTSHYYVVNKAVEILKKDVKELNIITCHLGNGCSMAAVKNGKSIDTTMGFTPLEGLLMGTRCGDIDPAAVLYIMSREELTMQEGNTLLNKHSGLLGISGISSDMRDLEQERENGNKNAALAVEIFSYRIKKYIGSYFASLGGADSIVFTGGIGENSSLVRKLSLSNLEKMGIVLDEERNNSNSGESRIITKDDSAVTVFVIPTNEELVIARETLKFLGH